MTTSSAAATTLAGPVLLLTDLSARCDRAMDRAVSLARKHQVELIALHVIDTPWLTKLAQPAWRTMQEAHRQVAEQQLAKDLSHSDVSFSAVIEVGNPIEVIEQVAKARQCALIVCGTARDETLGRIVLGTTVERLARQCETPLLIVRSRPFEPYRRTLLASDFSEGSRAAMQAALNLFKQTKFTLYHAFDQVAGIYDLDQPTIDEQTAAQQKRAQAFIENLGPEAVKRIEDVVIEHGAADHLLPVFVQAHDIELVVLGTHGVTGIIRTAMGSVAEKLLETLSCDVLMVRQSHQLDD